MAGKRHEVEIPKPVKPGHDNVRLSYRSKSSAAWVTLQGVIEYAWRALGRSPPLCGAAQMPGRHFENMRPPGHLWRTANPVTTHPTHLELEK